MIDPNDVLQSIPRFQTYPGSLTRDPDYAATCYVAADAPQAVLLEITRSGATPPERLKGALSTARIQPSGGEELTLRVFPFASTDGDNVRAFAETVAPEFLPRPQGALPAVAAGNRHPEISLPAAFEAYRRILEKTGVNWASTVQLSATREMTTDETIAARDGEDPVAIGHTRVSIRRLYHAGLWAAIRAGWRAGYNAEADHFIVSGSTAGDIARSVEMVKEAIRHAAGFTKFTTDTSRLFVLEADTRHPNAWSAGAVGEQFERIFTPEERRWIMGEFSKPFRMDGATYQLGKEQIERLAVKFGASLKLNEELYDFIVATKAGQRSAAFDFEPSIDEAETLTTPEELLFYMYWLKLRGRPAQLVPPNLGFKKRQAYPETMGTSPAGAMGLEEYCRHKMWPELAPRTAKDFGGKPLDELGARVSALAAVAHYFDGTLSIHSGSGKQPEVLRRIGQATGGRVNYKISGELQLQLLDVLFEQPPGSYWRQVYERMVDRTHRFAARKAFGAESELAAHYLALGRGSYLGDPAKGRVDGNLFLVFWVGNLAGTRDADSPDGDRRFFTEKLAELPAGLLAEVRRRNTEYIVWLATNLAG
jgi:hypothetical protein